MKKYFILFSVSVVISACKLSSNLESSSDTTAASLLTLDSANTFNKFTEYCASATRTNDLIHTKLEVSFDWEKQHLLGKATLTLQPYFYPVNELKLDARGMEINEVTLIEKSTMRDTSSVDTTAVIELIAKKSLTYSYAENVITIQLDKEYTKSETYQVFIDYVSKPNEIEIGGSSAISSDKGLYFINPDGTEDKPKQIWTQGETQANSVWFPTIDRPNERMTQEIFITVDNKYQTLSNGELVYSMENAGGTRTDYWKMDLPHAPYLAMMAIGEYAIVNDTWREKKVDYYVEKEYEKYAKNIFGNTPEMLEFYSKLLGVDYPWNKYSQVVARDYVSGAMENTTAVLFGEFIHQTDRERLDRDYEYIIAHELFHLWFGDLVTCESWSNLPLNESFATYGEYLWIEHKYGMDAADYHSARSRNGYLREAATKQENLIRFYYNDKEDMFDGHSYNKGGQILHMLRKYVGDEAFFASLKLYLEENKYDAVEIHNLRLAFEKVTGEDLNWFFNQWFLGAGHPELAIKNEYDFSTQSLSVRIQQVQKGKDAQVFKLPIAIDIYTQGKVKRHKVEVNEKDQTFTFTVKTKPDLVNVDAEKMVLCVKAEDKSVEEWAFQYNHAPLFIDREEALKGLENSLTDSLAVKTILSALNDKFWNIRESAIGMLAKVDSSYDQNIKDLLVKIASSDKKSSVRVAAINYLSSNYDNPELCDIYRNALQDSSYNVIGAGLIALTDAKPEEGLTLARKYEKSKFAGELQAVAELYAKHGNKGHSSFYVSAEKRFTRYSKIGFVTQYAAFLKNVNDDETILSGARLMADIANDPTANKWVKIYAKRGVEDVSMIFSSRISESEKKLKAIKPSSKTAAEIAALEKEIVADQLKQKKVLDMLSAD